MKDENFLRSRGVDIDKSLELFGDIETYNLTLNDFLGAISEKIEINRLLISVKYTPLKDPDNVKIISAKKSKNEKSTHCCIRCSRPR